MSTREKIVSLTPLEPDFFKANFGRWIDFQEVDLAILPGDASEEQVCEAVADATVIFGDGRHFIPVTRRIMEAAPRLKIIQMPSVGYDEVDLKAADELGIPVANTQGCNAPSVAEHAIMFMLVLLKRGLLNHEATLRGEWPQMDIAVGGKVLELGGKTLGILGLGAIGTEVAKRARVFGPQIIYNKRSRLPEDEEKRLGVEYAGFDELLQLSDILSVHVPLTPETWGMIGREEIAMMKPGAILLNLARGGVVDDAALAEALREGRLSGAGLDVFQDEPLGPGSVFVGVENVMTSPHVSGASKETMGRGFKMCGENLARVFRGEDPEYVVNLK
ncbi:MAG: 2-hydroxyacid dehydrogenase [Candidatus Bathyarchaeota archaeon]|nr:MAG: 2-hydroxyacid dehydrogenase [Candidatus Bathyarchaeota archaeon]